MTADGVIGLGNAIPWHYSADLRRFKKLTLGTAVIMGRKTWESLPVRPLPGRRNIVITGCTLPAVEYYQCLEEALDSIDRTTIWFIGGAQLYREAINHSDVLDITYVPDTIHGDSAIRFPTIDWSRWEAGAKIQYKDDQRLYRQQYTLKDRYQTT